MTECQGCGAWNDTSRTFCVLCGTPLAETDEWDAASEPLPLPPLPDGGLGASMPTWLRQPPPALPSSPHTPLNEAPSLGPRADPRTFLSEDDFPQWLRDLAARQGAAALPPQEAPPPSPAIATTAEPVLPADWPSWTGPASSLAATAAPDPEAAAASVAGGVAVQVAPAGRAPEGPTPVSGLEGRPPAAVVAARALEERRRREPWETLLLVVLFIGVVVAALWALVSNGVFSPGL